VSANIAPARVTVNHYVTHEHAGADAVVHSQCECRIMRRERGLERGKRVALQEGLRGILRGGSPRGCYRPTFQLCLAVRDPSFFLVVTNAPSEIRSSVQMILGRCKGDNLPLPERDYAWLCNVPGVVFTCARSDLNADGVIIVGELVYNHGEGVFLPHL